MDTNTTVIIVVVIFAVLALVWARFFRKRGKASIKVGPVEMSVEGENDAPAQDAPAPDRPGVSIKGAKAGGGILAEDNTGAGVEMEAVEAKDDILATTNPPDASPKA